MTRKTGYSKKGQAVAEMALFSGLILVVLGTLISYIQRFNDQQYVQMEAFRRALEQGCTFQGDTSEGSGASVQYTLIQHRKHIDLQSGFMKGSPQILSSSANIFWAVPKAGDQAKNLIILRVNEDEKKIDNAQYRKFVPEAEEETTSFQTESPNFNTASTFEETLKKDEDKNGISNSRKSTVKESVTTSVDYTIRNKSDDAVKKRGEFWQVQQRLYLDPTDGQYKYSSQVPQ
ncbi:MAG: hypothetical protein Q8N85_05320 [Candidatus Omnitrophota bacterium]|nr:hypothetical protein [Candidatus Omnitrophota bacterium]